MLRGLLKVNEKADITFNKNSDSEPEQE